MSLQLSLMDAQPAAAPVGLDYHPGFLSASDEGRLLAHIDGSEWLTDLSRRVMHFGYKYDYTSRSLDETARIGPLPEWLARLSHTVREAASEEAQQQLDPTGRSSRRSSTSIRLGRGSHPTSTGTASAPSSRP